ncbi:uncharacterized protein YneF (UPF0154 family) [Salirhabdus euzebyi]|uniref:Uncharacterized protein YneF (UPF0154 family) n=1 Tax=Salirhabdus euzebyi TaxID=394506 RepID=A0A841PSM5_9BACI|nr:hypothetical protein [Salirhabdus euzebyi]MBB6451957.1 uncharacterized protein YneF (UPF0154 family) [Salirhabdus euzebyi]
MQEFLKVFGGILIVVGLIGGFVVYDSDIAEVYEDAKKYSLSTSDEELAFAKQMQSDNIMNTSLFIGSGIIGGVFFLALGYILEQLMISGKETERIVKRLDRLERNKEQVG